MIRTSRSLLVAFTLVCLGAVPDAAAGVIFGDPDLSSVAGFTFSDKEYYLAEAFVLQEGRNVIADIHWWGIYYIHESEGGDAIAEDDFYIGIYADNGSGRPEPTPSVLYLHAENVVRTETEVPGVYAYSVKISPLALTPGTTYHLSIRNFTTDDPDNWWWSGLADAPGAGHWYHYEFDSDWGNFSLPDMAFTLTDDCANFAGFGAPIGGADDTGGTVTDPAGTFKLKSTVPIKMTLADCYGDPLTEGVHTIELIKWTSAVDSDPAINATPTDAATTGNAFRLADPATGEWHYNLDTRAAGMSKGTWEIKVTLSNGDVHTVFISLK